MTHVVWQTLRGRTRWLVLGVLIVLGAYLLFFTPVRTYIQQHEQMSAAHARYETLASANKELTQRAAQLQSDAEIERLARERYELVSPGQQAYAVMPPPAPPPPPAKPKKHNLWDKITFWK